MSFTNIAICQTKQRFSLWYTGTKVGKPKRRLKSFSGWVRDAWNAFVGRSDCRSPNSPVTACTPPILGNPLHTCLLSSPPFNWSPTHLVCLEIGNKMLSCLKWHTTDSDKIKLFWCFLRGCYHHFSASMSFFRFLQLCHLAHILHLNLISSLSTKKKVLFPNIKNSQLISFVEFQLERKFYN